jgi:hypothetical protein
MLRASRILKFIYLIKTDSKKLIKWSIVFGFLMLFALVYKIFDPGVTDFFPECIFYRYTGFKCPVCGSQIAVHHLMNFEIEKAFMSNALLVLAIPYIGMNIILDIIKSPGEKTKKLKNVLFGKKAVIGIVVIIVLFWIGRNYVDFF